jgi:trigger factor
MTDESREPEGAAPETTAVASPEEGADKEKAPEKLKQTVDIRDAGPCKKHIKVTVDRESIDARLKTKFDELAVDANVAGFRPGKAPRKVIEKRYHKDVAEQVKTELLLASLEQLAEENDIAPLTAPDIDPNALELPDKGPMVYEFDVEVRPEFDLPNYKGLKLRRPIHTFSDAEVEAEFRRVISPDGQVVPKPEGNAATGDILIAEIAFKQGDREIGKVAETGFQVDKQLAFRDGVAPRFAEQVQGANAGDKRVVDVELSQSVADTTLRGQTIQAHFDIKDVKTLRLPELTPDYLKRFGVNSADMLRELVNVFLKRRLEHMQRQSAREQVIQQIAASSSWQLPEDLLRRQAGRALARRRMEMQGDGIPEKEIQARLRLMQQDVLQSTALALKEHFVLQKIAEVEKIDVNEDDLNDEIERLANQRNESPRRLRAQLEREDMLDALMTEMYERKALDLILDAAEYEDVTVGEKQTEAPAVSSVEMQAVPGQTGEFP